MKQNSFLFGFTSNILMSTKKVAYELQPFLSGIESVMDVGCGAASWCKTFEDFGLTNFTLIDHPSVKSEDLLVSNKKNFVPIDLDRELPPVKRVDLLICTEVLEHFAQDRSEHIHSFLTECSDLILFSAAIPRQGGTGHLNEQRHSYWHKKFKEKGFEYFDGFKIDLIHDSEIIYHLRQNLFLYYKPTNAYRFSGHKNITSSQMELVDLYVLNKPLGIKELLAELPKAIVRNFQSRFGRKNLITP